MRVYRLCIGLAVRGARCRGHERGPASERSNASRAWRCQGAEKLMTMRKVWSAEVVVGGVAPAVELFTSAVDPNQQRCFGLASALRLSSSAVSGVYRATEINKHVGVRRLYNRHSSLRRLCVAGRRAITPHTRNGHPRAPHWPSTVLRWWVVFRTKRSHLRPVRHSARCYYKRKFYVNFGLLFASQGGHAEKKSHLGSCLDLG